MDWKLGGGQVIFLWQLKVWCAGRGEKLCELTVKLESRDKHWKQTGKWEGDFRRGRERDMLTKLTNKKKIIWMKTSQYTLLYRKCSASMLQIHFLSNILHASLGDTSPNPNIPTPTILYSNQSLVFKMFIHNFVQILFHSKY